MTTQPPVFAEQTRGGLVRSWWILFTLVPFGWLAFVSFAYAGAKANEPRWKRWAVVYLLMFWIATVIASVQELPYALRQVGGMVMLFGWAMPVVHALRIRQEYLAATDVPGATPRPPQPEDLDPQLRQDLEAARAREAERRAVRRHIFPRFAGGWFLFAGVVNILLGIFKYDFHPVSIVFGLAAAAFGGWILRRVSRS